MRLKLAMTAVVVGTLTGCGGSESDAPMDWSNYSPEVKRTITQQVKAEDCAGLQENFDTADANGNTDLMVYIDTAMKNADCY